MRAQGSPVTTALRRKLQTWGLRGCPWVWLPLGLASPLLPVCLFICGCGAWGWPGSPGEFMSSQHKTNNIRPSSVRAAGTCGGAGWERAPCTCTHLSPAGVRKGTPHCTSQHPGDGQSMSWCPNYNHPIHSRVSRGLCAPGPCTDTLWVSLGPPVVTPWELRPQGLCRDWGGCAGTGGAVLGLGGAVQELHWDHGGAILGSCRVCMGGCTNTGVGAELRVSRAALGKCGAACGGCMEVSRAVLGFCSGCT